MRFFNTLLVLLMTKLAISQSFDPKTFSSLKFRFIGPDGNRMIAVVGEPGNPMVSYAGEKDRNKLTKVKSKMEHKKQQVAMA